MQAELTEVKEHPILFTDQMVRAIRCGKKTQTRRIIKRDKSPECDRLMIRPEAFRPGTEFFMGDGQPMGPYLVCTSRYGHIGDRMWVKEGAIQIGHERTGRNGQYLWPKLSVEKGRRWFDGTCCYTADLRHNDPMYDEPHGTLNKMFMPRWASRLMLEITDVRAQRLHDISEQDADAEGCPSLITRSEFDGAGHTSRQFFQGLWNFINGDNSWALNPWVWAITFQVVAPSAGGEGAAG